MSLVLSFLGWFWKSQVVKVQKTIDSFRAKTGKQGRGSQKRTKGTAETFKDSSSGHRREKQQALF